MVRGTKRPETELPGIRFDNSGINVQVTASCPISLPKLLSRQRKGIELGTPHSFETSLSSISVIQVEESPRKHEALHICYGGRLPRLISRRTSSSTSSRSAEKATPLGSRISFSDTDWDCTFQLPGSRWRYWATNWISAPTLAHQWGYRASNRLSAPTLTHKWRYRTFKRLSSSTLA